MASVDSNSASNVPFSIDMAERRIIVDASMGTVITATSKLHDSLSCLSNGKLIHQYAKGVLSFSSQYGSELNLSYQVSNILGKPTLYPRYGDYTGACVFRTYGEWWHRCPSTNRAFLRHSTFKSEDFIELLFEKSVLPTKIEIFETYNPGAVVRILAYVDDKQTARWEILWEGENVKASAESNKLIINLDDMYFFTNILRIEFNQSLQAYYTELDAVYLQGFDADTFEHLAHSSFNSSTNPKWSRRDLKKTSEYVVEELSKLHLCEGIAAALNDLPNGYFDLLPFEIILLIISFLDFTSIGRLATTSSHLYKCCYDPHLYSELNLKPHWHKITDKTLAMISSRCNIVNKLSLAWCGSQGLLTIPCFLNFIDKYAKDITTLHLACCSFLDSPSFRKVCSILRTSLVDLDLQSCHSLDVDDFQYVSLLCNLKHLNLYRTKVDLAAFMKIVKNNSDLEHINLGSCHMIDNMDEACIQLGISCKKLVSLDLWRAKSLTSVGLDALSCQCIHLEELDIGWVSKNVSQHSIISLIKNCAKIRKLFLTAYRALGNDEMNEIANSCPFLEQLDILGNNEVTPESVQKVLTNCTSMIMIDISFCSQIDFLAWDRLCKQFPNVDIKKSYQND